MHHDDVAHTQHPAYPRSGAHQTFRSSGNGGKDAKLAPEAVEDASCGLVQAVVDLLSARVPHVWAVLTSPKLLAMSGVPESIAGPVRETLQRQA